MSGNIWVARVWITLIGFVAAVFVGYSVYSLVFKGLMSGAFAVFGASILGLVAFWFLAKLVNFSVDCWLTVLENRKECR